MLDILGPRTRGLHRVFWWSEVLVRHCATKVQIALVSLVRKLPGCHAFLPTAWLIVLFIFVVSTRELKLSFAAKGVNNNSTMTYLHVFMILEFRWQLITVSDEFFIRMGPLKWLSFINTSLWSLVYYFNLFMCWFDPSKQAYASFDLSN